MNKKLVLGIDFNNLLINSFYTSAIKNSRDENVNAIRGFFFKLAKLIHYCKPDFVVIANDIGVDKTFRRKMYKQYKSNRKPYNPDLGNQIKITLELLNLFGFPIINNPNYEADDILGMLSRFNSDNNMSTLLASADNDFLQLINNDVSVYNTNRQDCITMEYVYDLYRVHPTQLIDVKAINGDRSDNIPGALKLGENKALQLIREFDTLDNVYANIDKLGEKTSQILIEYKESIYMSKTLGTIITDYSNIDLSIDKLYCKPVDTELAIKRITDLEIPSIIFDIIGIIIPAIESMTSD